MVIFKKAYIRETKNTTLINFLFKFENFKNDESIIVKSMDGIGDIIIRHK